jgi:cell wall-associated NlpC family hydrolase
VNGFICRVGAGAAALASAMLLSIGAGTAIAGSGGTSAPGSDPAPAPTTTASSSGSDACSVGSGGVGHTNPTCAPVKKAKLVGGKAIAPSTAPPRVKAVIAAANKIVTKPYVWGGGHGSWESRGYDCSGSVSYALHGGRFLSTPLTSGSLAGWGHSGRGRWITVYANGGHAYAVIAGLRFDTSGDTVGTGPRWHTDKRSNAGFVKRHPGNY